MMTLCFRGVLALLCLGCLASYVQAEDGNNENDYLRVARENSNGYIRFGRNDPFLRFGKRNDPFLRLSRQDPFLRFGRQDPFLRFGRNTPYLRFGRNDPYLRFGRNTPYLRFGRNDPYLRFGKSDPFLRFGKSSEVESDSDAITLAREHGFADETEVNDRRKRSVSAEAETQELESPSGRETRDLADSVRNGKMDAKMVEEHSVRETRNGPYMRFGKKSEIDLDDGTDYDRSFLENEFSRFIRSYGGRSFLPRIATGGDNRIDKKQEYMRFGRGVAEI
uniref:FMRFamide-related protein n=1 Tax=Ambigolimax valentianus TaxID=1338344 RepID=D4AHV5_9EUPU|nr:FMRFamide-related protein precursor [Ambigolimax valentianus]